MLERADARLWFAMMSTACAVPAVVFVISAAWFMYFDFAPPIILGVPLSVRRCWQRLKLRRPRRPPLNLSRLR